LPSFFDVGEVRLDAAEVGAVRRQEQDVMTTFLGDSFKVFLFVESGVVVDDGRVWPQLFAQHVARPIVDQIGVGGAFEQHRCKEVFPPSGCNQAGSGAPVAGVIAIDFLSTRTPAVTAADIGFKTGFIDVNKIG
jgi:hypothetical protein